MKKNPIGMLLAAVFVLLTSFFGCQKSNKQDELIVDDAMFETEESTQIDEHNASNSLDFFGVYKGVLPCADCEGIETTIELGSGNSYLKKITYLGKQNQTVQESSGIFIWNDAGNTITLESEEAPNQYFVGENVLFHLDIEGNRITGDLAEKYQLKKQ